MADWKWQGPEKPDERKQPTPPANPPGAKTARGRALFKSRPGRMSSSMVALSAAAIVSVYAVGYMNTSAAQQALDEPASIPIVQAITATPTTAATSTSPAATATTARGQAAARTATPAAAAAPSATATAPIAAATGAYKDGTYVGLGTSRHGNIEVTVVVADGRITSAAVSSCQTHYSCSRISSLTGQVVSRQSAKVDTVSGATDSSKAYAKAVAAAIAQAVA